MSYYDNNRNKKRKIDFIIKQSSDERLIFRFYPRRSSCHSFGDEPPKSWSNVYKVYYSYAIIQQWKTRPDSPWKSEVLFSEHCDECSVISEIGHRCLLLSGGAEIFTREDGKKIELLNQAILPAGMGIEWTISKKTWIDWEDDDIKHAYYNFVLFDYVGKGFRFTIDEKEIRSFGEYLLECCEYMLAHGDPI